MTDEVDEIDIDCHLLAAADKYQINLLKSTCESLLMANIIVENAMEIGVASHLHGSDVFKNEITKFIAKNWSTIKDEKMETVKLYPKFLLEIMFHILD